MKRMITWGIATSLLSAGILVMTPSSPPVAVSAPLAQGTATPTPTPTQTRTPTPTLPPLVYRSDDFGIQSFPRDNINCVVDLNGAYASGAFGDPHGLVSCVSGTPVTQ
jgi:hypothetical protein